jgi:ADP-heptose:LPS heptosyltransferase
MIFPLCWSTRPRLRQTKAKDNLDLQNFLRGELARIQRILLVRLRSLGDAILTLPLINSLKSWRPDLQIDILIEAPYAQVFAHHPAIHEMLVVRSRKFPKAGGWPRIKAANEIRKRRYPAAMNLHGGATSKIFMLCSCAPLRIGEAGHRASWIYNAPIPSSSSIWGRPSLHTIEHQLSIMRWLALPCLPELAGALYINPIARERIRNRLDSEKISKFILIQPTATLATKQWSADKFAQLGDQLHTRYGLPIIYSAESSEMPVLQEIKQKAAKPHTYWQDLPLGELFALIDSCHLFVGNDSGPTHAASALKKPLVVVWGSSNFRAWHPWAVEFEAVKSDLPCVPCPGYTCHAFEEPKCITGIEVAKVFESCENILKHISEKSGSND